MNVLLLFLAMLIAGAITGLAYILSSGWILAAFSGAATLWVTEGIFERCLGYQPVQHWANHNNLAAH